MTQWPISDAVEEMPPGLWIRRGAPPPMFSMHRHDDVEINLVLDGQLHYLFGGQPLTIGEGEIAVFWAAQPHGLVDSRTGDMCWLHVPFSMFLSWGLPQAQTAPLLSAQPLITRAPDLAARIAHMAERWGEEVGGAGPGGRSGAGTVDGAGVPDGVRAPDGADRVCAANGPDRAGAADGAGVPDGVRAPDGADRVCAANGPDRAGAADGAGVPDGGRAPDGADRVCAANGPDRAGAADRADRPGRADDDSIEIALLEIQAAVRRVLRTASQANLEPPSDSGGSVPAARLRQVSAMAQYVRDHHRSPIAVADIAAAVHLAPSHAMTVFRRTAGVTLGDYVTMCRVAEAQRLLLTTSMKVTEIADAAGFGSLSSFYEHVSAACGMTPREYRRQGG